VPAIFASPHPCLTSRHSRRSDATCADGPKSPPYEGYGTNDPACSDENEVMETIERSARVSRAG
jgi:hypothetical protein